MLFYFEFNELYEIFQEIEKQNLSSLFNLTKLPFTIIEQIPVAGGKGPTQEMVERYFPNENYSVSEMTELNFAYWLIAPYIFSVDLKNENIKDVKTYLNEYICEFEKDNLEENTGWFSYQNHLMVLKNWEQDFENYGKNRKIYFGDLPGSGYRYQEFVLLLQQKQFINFENLNFEKRPKTRESEETEGLSFKLGLNYQYIKSPLEILDIVDFWDLNYGGIYINSKKGIAYYKGRRYPFKLTTGKAFKLLCLLIKNHGHLLDIDEAYDTIDPNNGLEKNVRTRKGRIKEYLKEIKSNLGIEQDKKPSLTIGIDENFVFLISNPPMS
jgi:hypothetical protein